MKDSFIIPAMENQSYLDEFIPKIEGCFIGNAVILQHIQDTGEPKGTSLMLDKKQAKKLIDVLQPWISSKNVQ